MADLSLRLEELGREEQLSNGHVGNVYADNQEFVDSSGATDEDISYEDDNNFQEGEHKHARSQDILRLYKEHTPSRSNSSNGSRQEQEDPTLTDGNRRTRSRQFDSQGDELEAEDEGLIDLQDCQANMDEEDQRDDVEEFFEYLDSFGEDGETLMSSSEAELDAEPKIVNLDHVDYILDNIDAELSHLINKSMSKQTYASPRSQTNTLGSERTHNKPEGDGRYQGSDGSEQQLRRSQNGRYHRDGTDEGTEDTGLGSGSPMEETEENNNISRKSSKHHLAIKGRRSSSEPLKIPIIEVSDADSVTSEEVQIRLQETLRKHDASSSVHSHSSNHGNKKLTARNIVDNYDHTPDQPDEEVEDMMNEEVKIDGSVKQKKFKKRQLKETQKTSVDVIRRHQRSRSSSQSTLRSRKSVQMSETSRPSSCISGKGRQKQNGSENGPVTTEEFERVFHITNTPSELQSPRLFQSRTRNSTKVPQKSEHGPVKANHQIHVSHLYNTNQEQQYADETPRLPGKKPPQSRKHRKSNSVPGRPSGLPDYMYLRKEVGESDLGSDSIGTEDYEGLFAAAMIPRDPDLGTKSSTRRGSPKAYGGQSDPESIKTEEFERHFRGLLIKQVAGVPVRNFDTVTISSDLDSVRTTDVFHKFQEVLKKGGKGGSHRVRPVYDVQEMNGRHRSSGKQRRLQRAERVTDSDSDLEGDQDGSIDGDSIKVVLEASMKDVHGNRRRDVTDKPMQRSKGAKRAREKDQEKLAAQRAAASGHTGLRKLLSPTTPHGSPRKSKSFSDLTPTPDRSPSCSPPRSPGLLAPPPRFKDHSKLRQSRSFDETLKRRQGQSPQVYQWTEQSLPQRRSPKWIGSRQDSVSTYEEVESLSSHQVSSSNSRNNSEGPSRLASFGSSGSSLDRSGEYAFHWRIAGIENPEDFAGIVERTSNSVSRSGSMGSSSPSHSYSDHNSRHSARSSVSDGTHSDGDMQSDVAKWVDQTRKETARKRSDAGIADVEVKSNEAPDVQLKAHNKAHQSGALLNMECGDIIGGSSMDKMQLPNETERELALRLRNTSPLAAFSRTTSFDSTMSTYSDLRTDIAWTPAEDVLMNLGFGGPDLGIPDRFLTSWKEKVYTKRMENVRKLLRSHSSQSDSDYSMSRYQVMEKVQEEPDPKPIRFDPPAPAPAPALAPALGPSPPLTSAPVPPPIASYPVRERELQQKPIVPPPTKQIAEVHRAPPKQMTSSNSCDACTDTSDLQIPVTRQNSNVHNVQPKTSAERLHHYRKRLLKAATVSNFGQTLAEMARNRKGMQPNMQPPPPKPSNSQLQQDMQKRINMVSRKSRGSGRGRRKYFVKQSSLPVSLETLPEEEELIKPRNNDMRSQRSISLDTDEPYRNCPLKIVMEQPSIESREAMSRQGTCDIDIDEAIADVDVDRKQPDKMEKYLTVMKDIIESKDSGFENEPSQNGSPQHMSPQSVEDEFMKGMGSGVNPKQQSLSGKSNSQPLPSEESQPGVLSKETKSNENVSKSGGTDTDTHLGINTKDCLDVKSTSSRNSSRSDDSMTFENKSHHSSRRSSMSSEKSFGPRPSLVDMQEVFCQTIEEDDDSVFMTSPVPPEDEDVECICICIQTSPELHSPPLSPLECGYVNFYQINRNPKQIKSQHASETNQTESAPTVVDQKDSVSYANGPSILVRTMSNAGNQASLDAVEPLLLDHDIEPIANSNVVHPYVDRGKELTDSQSVVEVHDKTSNANKDGSSQGNDISMQAALQPVSPLQLSQVEHIKKSMEYTTRSSSIPEESSETAQSLSGHDDMSSISSLPMKDINSTRWPEMGSSPTHEDMDSYVQDTSAGFVSDTSDCLPESEEEQLAEKATQLRRRRSLRPEWATPERRGRLLATGGSCQGESSDGSEASLSRQSHVRIRSAKAKRGSNAKSDQEDETKHDKLSDSDSKRSGNSTSDALSVVTDPKLSGTDESSPSSVYRYSHLVNTHEDTDKPADLIRSNSDLIKRLSGSRSVQSVATPHTPLKRSMSVEALNHAFVRPRTLSERGYLHSDFNFHDPLGSSKHYNTVRGSSSTGGYKSRIKLPMNTPEILKLASMKLERLIHKGAIRPVYTYNESFQEEAAEEESENETNYASSKEGHLVSEPTDSKNMDKIRDEHISLPDNKNLCATSTPHTFLFPSPSSDKTEGDKKLNIRQNSSMSDRSSDKSLQSPSTRPPSVPSIFTKGPTLESTDSLDVVCFSELGDEKRPPLKSRDFGAWSSQSSSSPSYLSIPAFHSPDLPDFENRPTTTSPSEMSVDDKEESKIDVKISEPVTEKDTLDVVAPNSFAYPPLSPRRLEHLYTDSPSPCLSYLSNREEHKDGDSNETQPDRSTENAGIREEPVKKYYSSTHHEICHTVPLPKLSVNQDGSKVPTILHKLATISTSNSKSQNFTIHLEVPPLNYQETNNNVIEEKHTSVKLLELSPKQDKALDIGDKETENDWIGGKHYRAPYYWDVTDSIPVFPLYRDGHFTTDISHQDSFIPRMGGLHEANATMPTFDEICSKAGRLIQNLERTVTVERFVPVDPAPVDSHGEREYNQSDHGHNMLGNQGTVVMVNVVDHAGNSTGHDSDGDTAVVKDENDTIEEETVSLSQRLFEGAGISGISNKQKKKLNGSHQGTPPDWGAKLETLANLEDLMETERDMRRRFNSLEKSYDEVKDNKQMALKELKTLQEAVHRNKADIQKAEEMTATNLERADGIRSELMVLEYQRDQARRELKDLEESIHARQGSTSTTGKDREEGNGSDADTTDEDLLSLSASQIREIIQERDDLKSRLRRGQGDFSPVERSELERQLSATKKELFDEQKSSRARKDQMEEELEESRLRIDELSMQKTELGEQLEQLNHTLQATEKNSQRHEELSNNTSKLQDENDHLQRTLLDKDEYIASAKASVREKEQMVTKLREELMKAKRELTDVKDARDALMQERREDFKKLDMDKALAVDAVRDAMKKEKQVAIDQIKFAIEKEKREALARQEEKLQEQMAVKHSLLLTKEEQLLLLKEDLKRLKRSADQAEDDRALEMQRKIQEAVDKAKETWEEEMGRNKRREQAMREEEFAKETAKLHEEIRREKRLTENTKATIGALKEEIAELQEKKLAAGREKVEAVSEARDAIREEMQSEWDSLRQQMTQEKIQEVEKLKQKLAQRDEELDKLRSEVKKKVQNASDTIDKTSSRGIIAEINEECKRTASIIGTHKNINGLKNDKTSKSSTPSPAHSNGNHGNSHHGATPGRAQVLAALGNLRSSNDELRSYVQNVKEDLERQKKMVAKIQRDKDAESKRLKDNLHQEKSQDMEAMRERLVQEHLKVVEDFQQTIHSLQSSEANLEQKLLDKDEELRDIQKGMSKWKEDSAYKMAKKFEEELSRELEIRLHEKSEREDLMKSGPKSTDRVSDSTPPSTPSTNDAATIRLLRNLQERVRHLQAENISLRKNGRTFPSDRSPQPTQNQVEEREQQIYHLQQKLMLLDRQLHIAEDRCRDNAVHLSEKGAENSKLQSALAQQTKELMRMERAYAKLSQAARRPPVAL